jgi:hypothetical protein
LRLLLCGCNRSQKYFISGVLLSEENFIEKDLFGNIIKRNLFGEYHSVDGPAIISNCGSNYWYFNGDLHRVDGPAVNIFNGEKKWFLRGERISNKEDFFNSLSDEEKEKAIFSEDFLNA